MPTIKELQDLDPLAEAEKITGASYKNDDLTVKLGIVLQMEKSREMNKLMNDADDTKFSETTEEYIRKVTDFGFEEVLRENFESDGYGDEKITESFFVFWHKLYSILLIFDTFRGNRNGGKFYYNWSPNDMKNEGNCTSSGGFYGFYWKSDFSEQLPYSVPKPKWSNIPYEEYQKLSSEWSLLDEEYRKQNNLRALWAGNHDCREALKFNINNLASNGVFLKQWKKQPFLYFVHHGDISANYEKLNKQRIAKLPDYVRQCIEVESIY